MSSSTSWGPGCGATSTGTGTCCAHGTGRGWVAGERSGASPDLPAALLAAVALAYRPIPAPDGHQQRDADEDLTDVHPGVDREGAGVMREVADVHAVRVQPV